jgi:hypothetical protein
VEQSFASTVYLQPCLSMLMRAAALFARRTVNNQKTMVMQGGLVAKPFPTSSKPFVKKEPVSIIYGA